MILELIPEAGKLSTQEKRQLAEELLLAADREEGGDAQVESSVLELLEERLAAYEASPEKVTSWDVVRDRVFRAHES